MERSCARAKELGLPSIAFTEHADFTAWSLRKGDWVPGGDRFAAEDEEVAPPEFDAEGYFACLERCRERFPELQILSGVELGEPHRHAQRVTQLLGAGSRFDRVLGSVHTLADRSGFAEVASLYREREVGEVVREYLVEAARMVKGSDALEVLAHIDFPLRYWPKHAGPYDPTVFEDEYRMVLRELAGAGKALEVNTVVPLSAVIVRWWWEEGGTAVSFGSDAHEPSAVARDFAQTAAMVEAQGFRAGRRPHDFWIRA